MKKGVKPQNGSDWLRFVWDIQRDKPEMWNIFDFIALALVNPCNTIARKVKAAIGKIIALSISIM